MKKYTKLLAVMLSLVMLVTAVLPNYALASDLDPTYEQMSSNTTILYVDDGEGNIVPVEVTEIIYEDDEAGISPRALTPEYTPGTKRTYVVKVSNNVMGAPSVAGSTLSLAAKTTAAKTVKNAIVAKLGANFLPGVNFVVWALSTVAFINAVNGNTGIKVTVNLKYSSTYIHKEGYYLYGWSPTSLSISPY